MSAVDEKSVVVTTTDATGDAPTSNHNILTITRPSPARQHQQGLVLSTIQDVDSTHSLSPPPSATNEKSILDSLNSPYEYHHSHNDESHSDSKMNVNVIHSSFENDLEAQALTQEKTQASQSKSNLLKNKTKSCVDPAWPGRNHLKMQRKIAKRERACCRPWAALSKKTKGIISAVIFLVILGIALGVGFGISSRVGGTIQTGNGTNKPINTK
ncbi:uncharacterized protein LY89DRAFT_735586 [Mollisia scopiformis]|uniref:Uncharacterized protein n=1 Tax=Mollisia scopiformis TaxID=149040 RepID=A0A194X5M8_MOLSC|nr:uncharacterized protein LY89DRAFT_735586 [Mollisia scopiformis]KUJ15480.1 hypothetical protein LY89DRAFT_735586 [Mollisia scopiformis]